MKQTKALFFLLLVTGCSAVPPGEVVITGRITNAGSAGVSVERKALHYKYAPEIRHDLLLDESGNMSMSLPLDEPEVAELQIDSIAYPIVLFPGEELEMTIDANNFPFGVEVGGYASEWNERYQSYLDGAVPADMQINEELPSFREGGPNRVLELHQKKIELAKQHLGGTPLKTVYFETVGEYLNRALQNVRIEKKNNPGFDREAAREELVDYAHQHEFFSLESLMAQRAGIRDFVHYYAMSFDVQDSLRAIHGEEISDRDIERLGYEQLNRYHEQVIEEISEPEAVAYARMHLVALRMEKMPMEIAEPTLHRYLDRYGDYEEYAEFLKNLHDEMTAVSPGQPAVPFTLPDQHGRMVSMSDFDGKYLLLDFWASWCLPCLDEFPHMKRIYENTSREQFEIVAISTEEDSLRWREALDRFNNPWVQLYGGDAFQQETFVQYKGGGIPFYILINPEGRIERYNDIRASFNLENLLDSLLAPASRPGDDR